MSRPPAFATRAGARDCRTWSDRGDERDRRRRAPAGHRRAAGPHRRRPADARRVLRPGRRGVRGPTGADLEEVLAEPAARASLPEPVRRAPATPVDRGAGAGPLRPQRASAIGPAGALHRHHERRRRPRALAAPAADVTAFAFWGGVKVDLRYADHRAPVVDVDRLGDHGRRRRSSCRRASASTSTGWWSWAAARPTPPAASSRDPGAPLVRVHARGLWGGVSAVPRTAKAQRQAAAEARPRPPAVDLRAPAACSSCRSAPRRRAPPPAPALLAGPPCRTGRAPPPSSPAHGPRCRRRPLPPAGGRCTATVPDAAASRPARPPIAGTSRADGPAGAPAPAGCPAAR